MTIDQIVCYGRDDMLLSTRMLILRSAGLSVSIASDDPSFRVLLTASMPRVIVLCHSLSERDCLRAADYAREMSPYSKLLLIINDPIRYQIPRHYATLNIGERPEVLIGKVEELIEASRQEERAKQI